MGQTIEINDARRIGDVLVIDSDRSITGQEGEAYTHGNTTEAATFPARLAERLLAADPAIERVHVISNMVSIRRTGGWDDGAAQAAQDTVARFFRFYDS